MNYRQTRCYHNCEKALFEGEGTLRMPAIEPTDVDVSDTPLIGFNYALTEKHPEDKIVHFFIDDYQFDRVWNNPDAYLAVLGRFKAVVSPDFSLYLDFPPAVQHYNNYRRQWCGAYWQEHGITVIPTVRWSDEDSYEWCFDGIPHHSLVCISTVGGFKEKTVSEKWMQGYRKAMEVLEPSYILFFGKVYPKIPIPCKYTCAPNLNTLKRLEASRELKKKTDMLV